MHLNVVMIVKINSKVFLKVNQTILNSKKIKKCLDGENFQSECVNYVLRSINHEMDLQEIKKSTLSIFDDKRYYINNIESKPWN